VLIHARILLKPMSAKAGPGWDDEADCRGGRVWGLHGVPGAPGVREEGLPAALFRKKPTGRQYRKLDGAQEAHLIALACGAPPKGGRPGTLAVLADRLVELEVVDSISPECVRTTLKKTNSSRGCGSSG